MAPLHPRSDAGPGMNLSSWISPERGRRRERGRERGNNLGQMDFAWKVPVGFRFERSARNECGHRL